MKQSLKYSSASAALSAFDVPPVQYLRPGETLNVFVRADADRRSGTDATSEQIMADIHKAMELMEQANGAPDQPVVLTKAEFDRLKSQLTPAPPGFVSAYGVRYVVED